MTLTLMLVILGLVGLALGAGVLIGRWIWAGRRHDVAAKTEEHECYKQEVGTQLGVVLDALDQAREQVKRSASELGEPVLVGKAERALADKSADDQPAALENKDEKVATAEPAELPTPDEEKKA